MPYACAINFGGSKGNDNNLRVSKLSGASRYYL